MSAPAATTAPTFEHLTEAAGTLLTREGADMLFTRYQVGAELAKGKRVLELACGAAVGFGLMGAGARTLVGGDIDAPLLGRAKQHYGTRFPFVRLSAESLPFREASFDVVLFFEASYYVPDAERAFDEITRVLAPGGTVLVVNANPQRPDFIRSPHTHRYHSAADMRRAFEGRGFSVITEAAFPLPSGSGRGGMLGVARTFMDRLGLVPRSLRARALLKRLVFGRLIPLPPEISGDFGTEAPRAPVDDPVTGFKVVYVTARR